MWQWIDTWESRGSGWSLPGGKEPCVPPISSEVTPGKWPLIWGRGECQQKVSQNPPDSSWANGAWAGGGGKVIRFSRKAGAEQDKGQVDLGGIGGLALKGSGGEFIICSSSTS